jgi:branched-chain amino acid transport system ATP-binding protein
MLTLEEVRCSYGGMRVLHDVSLRLAPGEVLGLLGRNGAGKTTTLRAIMGLVRPEGGSIRIDGTELTALRAHEIPRLGVAYVPQGRGLFSALTVADNMRMGLLVRPHSDDALEEILDLFPVLRERLGQRAGTLSGGEQQMLAMARALCASPRYLLMDEPTEGLMPAMVQTLLDTVHLLRARGAGVLLVEQKIDAVLKVADAVALMENGRIRHQGSRAELASHPDVLIRYLGVTRGGH